MELEQAFWLTIAKLLAVLALYSMSAAPGWICALLFIVLFFMR